MQLSESAQREAQQPDNAHHVIAAILDRAVKGSGAAIRVKTLYSAELLDKISSLVARVMCMDFDYKPPDFAAWYKVRVPTGRASNSSALVQGQDQCRQPCDLADELVRRLSGPGFPQVEYAHRLRLRAIRASTASAPDPIASRQPYLGPSETGGIEAEYAWSKGYTGTGINFVDVEQGWDLVHPDLPALAPPSSGINYSVAVPGEIPTQNHGTEALGVVLMTGKDPSGLGGKGVASNGTGRVFSEIYDLSWPQEQPMNAIADAATSTPTPHVILVECQASDNDGNDGYPVEIQTATHQAICLATKANIVVVEPAGDANANLDNVMNDASIYAFQPAAKDSGAIIVGAANAQQPDATALGAPNKFPRLSTGLSTALGNPGSCFGSRVDLFAWGNNVYTTAPPPTMYTSTEFTATSSAAAIIAGAAMIVQSLALNVNAGQPFSPSLVRSLLKQAAAFHALNHATEPIGVMPNLMTIIGQYLNLAPQLYMRDRVGDDGGRPSSITAQSPDIIVQQSAVSDPQSRFGGNGARNDDTLSQPVQPGKTHWIYVRLLSRGGEHAAGVSVNVYWSPPTMVPTPDKWTAIGTATLSCVPNQNVLMVSDAIEWVADDVPEDGYVCLIAVAGSEQSPAPVFDVTPADCAAADDNEASLEFIAGNNNIAMCNVHLVPPALDGQHLLRFSIPCDRKCNQVYTIESLGSLPRGAEVRLRLPLMLVRQLHVKLREGCCDEEYGEIPLLPMCPVRIGEGALQANEAAPCELRVRVPERMHEQPGIYELAVRQLSEGREVGRVTWRFVQSGQTEAVFSSSNGS